MKRYLLLQLLLLPLWLFAQGFGSFSSDQPFFAKDVAASSAPSLPSGIAFRWVASDLTNTPVALWTDRIQGRNLVQATGANQPTWSTNSLVFDNSGSQFMTLTNPVSLNMGATGTNALLVVYSANQINITKWVIDSDDAGHDAFLWQNFGGSMFAGAVNLGPQAAAGKNREYLYGGSQNPFANNHYTNGLFVVASSTYNAFWTYLGRKENGTFPWWGTVKEIVVWTNVTSSFSTNEVAQIHNYVTNTYNPSTF